MENAVDALKMGGAALLFILAFSITMIMFGQCKTTADIVITNLQLNSFMQGINGNAENVTRKVGLETVIPTLYRYSNEDSALRVIIQGPTDDHNENVELQVFDVALEQDVQKGKNYTIDMDPYLYYLQTTYNDSSKPAYMFDAPWVNNDQKTLERINCYISGKEPTLLRGTEMATRYRENNLLYYAKGDHPITEYDEIYT